jgi:hypothetical protein
MTMMTSLSGVSGATQADSPRGCIASPTESRRLRPSWREVVRIGLALDGGVEQHVHL